MKRKIFMLLILAVFFLAGCGAQEPAAPVVTEPEIITLPTAPAEQTRPTDPDKQAEHLAVVMEAGELYQLNSYPNLKSVDLTGSTCYDAILEYMEKHPQIQVTYSVGLGGTAVASGDTQATLEAGRYAYELLRENLQYLPNLQTLRFPGMELNASQVDTLRQLYPQITLEYTVDLLGQSYALETEELDLSAVSPESLTQIGEKLGLLPNLKTVYLSDELTFDQVDAIQTQAPQVRFSYSFQLFGKTVNTADDEVVYKNQNIGNDGEEEIRAALKILDHCERFVLDNCKLDYEVLDKIRADFRDGPKVVWRVYFGVDGRYNLLTDADTLRAVYNVTDATCGPMKYCEDVKYMDIGHNETLTDLSFIGYMPNIEVVIASGCAVKELVGLENCKKLTWLELAYCYKLENIDCLSGCESLRFLNLSFTKVNNFMPLDSLPLERFVCLSPKANAKEQETFLKIHPKGTCLTVFYGYTNPYGYGWRYDDNGKTFNEYYKTVVREAFNYDLLETYLPKEDKK